MFPSTFMKLLLVLILVAPISSRRLIGGDYTFELPDQEETCFSEIFEEKVKILFEFKVIRGGNHDVNVKIISPSGRVVYKQTKMKEDIVTMEPYEGEWRFCFNNEFSTISHKTIFFSIRRFEVESLSQESGKKQVPTVKVAAETSMDEIHRMLSHVKEFQTRYRLQESISRYIAEQLNRKVAWWSFCQALVVVLAGFGQIFVLKTFFTDHLKTSTLKPPTS